MIIIGKARYALLCALEAGPLQTQELAAKTSWKITRLLNGMAHEGLVVELTKGFASWAHRRWALPKDAPAAAAPSRPVNGHAICRRCQYRYPQKDGLCRACGRAAGVYAMSVQEADRDRIRRHTPPLRAVEPTRPTVTRVIDGVEYDVVFDGRGSVCPWPDHDIPTGSSLSGGSYQVRRA